MHHTAFTMKTTTKKITKFNSLSEAVKHADLDLSYNQFTADQEIKSLEDDGVDTVYVTEDNEVYYIYQCDIRILHKFSPFSHCISNSPFQHVYTIGDELTFTDTFIQKNAQNRKTIALHDMLVH